GSSWTAAARHVDQDQPSPQSAYWPALQQVEKEVGVTMDTSHEPAVSEDIALDFLSPADKPGFLGRLSHFDVVEVIGRGGMGLVLKAMDACLQRYVAIKVLDPQFANNELARKRFCREARAAAAITHEYVVAIHQVEEDESSGLPLLVMQFIDG